MNILIMGDSWAAGCWKDVKIRGDDGQLTNRFTNYHQGIGRFMREDGHTVEWIAKGGSHNITQLWTLQSLIHLNFDLIVWLWTDCIREYDWYREHQQGVHDLYDIHRNTELWVQDQITEWQPDLWSKMRIIGGCAPLMTEWPCEQLTSWCSAQGHIWIDHPTVDPVNWRDFVNWCNGKNTIYRLDHPEAPEFSHVHQMWWSFIAPFTHSHKAHHMEFLQRSQDRQTRLVYGSDHDQYMKGMMGEDLHPNLDSHRWLKNWVYSTL